MLSMHDNEEFLFEALRVGRGGLRAQVLGRIGPGRRVPHRDARRAVPVPEGGRRARARLPRTRARAASSAPGEELSPRESEVVKLIAEGHTSREIADILSISVNTVERHRHNVLEKLELRDRVALTLYAVRRGLVQP